MVAPIIKSASYYQKSNDKQMKQIHIKSILSLFTMYILVFFSSCGGGGDTEPSLQELAFQKLSGDWELGTNGSITLDGQNESLNYSGFSLSFTSERYTTSNAGVLFNATGTWSWTDASTANQVTLDDGKVITINTLNTSNFNFSFTHYGGTGGVANGPYGIHGSYTINVYK